MLRRFTQICVLIWAAAAAHFVEAQAKEIAFVTLEAAADACRPTNNGMNCNYLQFPIRYYAHLINPSAPASTFYRYDPYNCPASGPVGEGWIRAASGTECFQVSYCPQEFDLDGNHCFTGKTTDLHGYGANGYNDDNCTYTGCPTDPGWRDAEGYDYDGFDENGFDRGGLTAEQGGGYGGWAGTGGTPPPGWTPPTPPDYGNGINYNGNGVYVCHGAYPVSILKSAVPGAVFDGLGACSGGCEYQPASIYFDFDTGSEYVTFDPTGYVCQGGQPVLTGAQILQHVPVDDSPSNPWTEANICFASDGYLYCRGTETGETRCYVDTGTSVRGPQVSCGSLPGLPDPDGSSVCGIKNGVYNCVNPATRCQSYHGEIVCVDPNNNVIDPASPDHPINGGNGNGLDYDDVFGDWTDVANNGWTVQQRQSAALNAYEIARAIDTALSDDFARLNTQQASIADPDNLIYQETELLTDALQGVGEQGGLGFTDPAFSDHNWFGALLPTASACQAFEFPLLPDVGLVFTLDTCQLELFRTLAEWLVYALTCVALYRILVTVREVR